MNKIVPVLLAGGAGTRLWPVSRDALPKQFLPLIGERSTYQETLLRVADRELFAAPVVVTGAEFRFFAKRQADDLRIDATVVIEPMRRDSGPALAAAAALARIRDPDAVVLALAADHVIPDADLFRETCLPGREAEILLLKYSEDWTYRQIADHLGLTSSAVEARLHRARQRLRRKLAALDPTLAASTNG